MEAGLIYTAVSHQGATEMLWPRFWGAVVAEKIKKIKEDERMMNEGLFSLSLICTS